MRDLTFDRKLVNAYVNGDDLGKYSEEELENDFNFMQDVLTITNDKNMFNYASDKLRNNIDFVIKTIKFFKEDEEFVNELYIKFLANNPDKLETFTIYLYNMFRGSKTSFAIKMEEESNKVFNKLNVYDTFYDFVEACDNNIKLTFVARRLVCNMFYNDEKYTLAGILHNNMTTREAKAIKPATFVMNYINKHDVTLGDYVNVDRNIISDVFLDVKNEYKKWDAYENRLNEIRVQKAIMLVYEYVKNNDNKINIQDLLSYVIYELELNKAFELYDSKHHIKGLRYEDYKDNYKNIKAKPNKYEDLETKISNVFKKDYLGERKK